MSSRKANRGTQLSEFAGPPTHISPAQTESFISLCFPALLLKGPEDGFEVSGSRSEAAVAAR